MDALNIPYEFDWDQYNREHLQGHRVESGECEQVFFNIPFTVKPDMLHSIKEKRYFALGKTNRNRVLVIIFTLRNEKVRVITARDANRRERREYETQKDSGI